MRKYLPYIAIFVFSFGSSIIRLAMLEEWTIVHNIYAFFFQAGILIAIWLIIQALNKYLQSRFPFSKSVLKRMLIQVSASLITTAPLLVVVDIVSEKFFPHLDFMTNEFKAVAALMFTVVVVLVNFSFYALYFFDEWKRSVQESAWLQIQTAKTEKEKAMMQYEHLKNQVNPHFLFNTLTSLDGLILSDPELASQFVRHLSKVYRYVLEHSGNEVVRLSTELEFIQHYISVLKIKHNGALHIQIDISDGARQKGIAMVTLQMLIDNAIKHNIVYSKTPLTIKIRDENAYLSISNNKQLRKQIETSTKHGLKHLQQLYKFIAPSPVIINDTESTFEVKLPLL